MNYNTEGLQSPPQEESVTPNNRNWTLLNSTSSGQRKSCAVDDGDEGDLPKDHTPLYVLKLELLL